MQLSKVVKYKQLGNIYKAVRKILYENVSGSYNCAGFV